jgi:ribonuclease HII
MATGSARKKTANLLHEHQYIGYGYRLIVGLDEVGRGAWAGPVVAGAVCLPVENPDLSKIMRGVNDSKQLTARQRSDLVDKVKAVALAWGIGSASHDEIDTLGIVPATMAAMQRALDDAIVRSSFKPDVLFIDAMLLPEIPSIPQVSLIGGDARSISIAAASIIAKVWRDAYMTACADTYPAYHFADNKGYGGGPLSSHQRALELWGPCAIHRRTFAPVQAVLRKTGRGDT